MILFRKDSIPNVSFITIMQSDDKMIKEVGNYNGIATLCEDGIFTFRNFSVFEQIDVGSCNCNAADGQG